LPRASCQQMAGGLVGPDHIAGRPKLGDDRAVAVNRAPNRDPQGAPRVQLLRPADRREFRPDGTGSYDATPLGTCESRNAQGRPGEGAGDVVAPLRAVGLVGKVPSARSLYALVPRPHGLQALRQRRGELRAIGPIGGLPPRVSKSGRRAMIEVSGRPRPGPVWG